MSRAAAPLAISDGQREVLEALATSQSSSYRMVVRARALLLAGDGVSNSTIGEMVGISRPTVLAWRGQFEKEGLVGFGEVAKGRGPKPSISEEKIAEIVDLTLHSTPEGETHWSCRSMAKEVGVSSASVQRIWSVRGLKPHLVKTFTLSNDKNFEAKLVEFLKFLRIIDREVPKGLQIHMICDNYGTHKHPNVTAWLAKHPRFQLHFIPTSSSWLNLVERWFRELTDKAIRRGVFHSVDDLITAIEDYLKANNDNPKPFVWTAAAEQILAKVARGRVALQQVKNQ